MTAAAPPSPPARRAAVAPPRHVAMSPCRRAPLPLRAAHPSRHPELVADRPGPVPAADAGLTRLLHDQVLPGNSPYRRSRWGLSWRRPTNPQVTRLRLDHTAPRRSRFGETIASTQTRTPAGAPCGPPSRARRCTNTSEDRTATRREAPTMPSDGAELSHGAATPLSRGRRRERHSREPKTSTRAPTTNSPNRRSRWGLLRRHPANPQVTRLPRDHTARRGSRFGETIAGTQSRTPAGAPRAGLQVGRKDA